MQAIIIYKGREIEELVFGKSNREKELYNHVNIVEPVNLDTADVMRLGKVHPSLSQSFFQDPSSVKIAFMILAMKSNKE